VSGGGKQRRRGQSVGEELANSVSHGVGLLAALIASPSPVIGTIQRGNTAGVGFFAAPRVPYTHFVWHLFVTAGTTCHFVAVLRYAGRCHHVAG
jgi:predicted membrane channel-forming protein YqfA (hemolysin III family)